MDWIHSDLAFYFDRSTCTSWPFLDFISMILSKFRSYSFSLRKHWLERWFLSLILFHSSFLVLFSFYFFWMKWLFIPLNNSNHSIASQWEKVSRYLKASDSIIWRPMYVTQNNREYRLMDEPRKKQKWNCETLFYHSYSTVIAMDTPKEGDKKNLLK